MSEKKGLPRPPLYTDDYITMAEALEFMMEQFGQLILAIMYYTANGATPDNLSPDLKVMFAIYQKKIDFAREKYEQKCATNAKNGQNGGRPRKGDAAATFKLPTLKQFQTTIKHYLDTGDIEEINDYDMDVFFDRMKGAGWSIGGEPIQRRSDWESATLARFGAAPQPFTHQQYYSVFETVFSTLHAMRDSEGRSQADDIAYNFFDTYDESTKTWIVDGEAFKDMESALAKFMQDKKTE